MKTANLIDIWRNFCQRSKLLFICFIQKFRARTQLGVQHFMHHRQSLINRLNASKRQFLPFGRRQANHDAARCQKHAYYKQTNQRTQVFLMN